MYLTHYTKSLENVRSILENGFFYSFRPTRVFDKIFDDAEIDAVEPDVNGMICFTEYELSEASKHRDAFGSYGISVSLDWALSKGAKKVEYLNRGSNKYNVLLNKIKSGAPKDFDGFSLNEQNMPKMEKTIRQLTLGKPINAHMHGADNSYLEAINELKWIQISAHQDQKEWRIINPVSTGGIYQRIPTKRDLKFGRIDTNSPFNLAESIKIFSRNAEIRDLFFLPINIEAIIFIIIPQSDEKIIKSWLKTSNVPIEVY